MTDAINFMLDVSNPRAGESEPWFVTLREWKHTDREINFHVGRGAPRDDVDSACATLAGAASLEAADKIWADLLEECQRLKKWGPRMLLCALLFAAPRMKRFAAFCARVRCCGSGSSGGSSGSSGGSGSGSSGSGGSREFPEPAERGHSIHTRRLIKQMIALATFDLLYPMEGADKDWFWSTQPKECLRKNTLGIYEFVVGPFTPSALTAIARVMFTRRVLFGGDITIRTADSHAVFPIDFVPGMSAALVDVEPAKLFVVPVDSSKGDAREYFWRHIMGFPMLNDRTILTVDGDGHANRVVGVVRRVGEVYGSKRHENHPPSSDMITAAISSAFHAGGWTRFLINCAWDADVVNRARYIETLLREHCHVGGQ